MRIQEVPLNLVNQVWPHAERFIDSAMHYSGGDYTAEDARVLVTLGQWSLIVAVDEQNVIRGAATVSYFNRPHDRVAFITALGGRLVTSQENAAQLFEIFRANGAMTVEAAARDDILRLWKKYGLELKYHIISASL